LDSTERLYFFEILSTRANKLNNMPLATLIIIAIAILTLVAALDSITGSEVNFSLFYLLPVAFTGGFISHRAGLFMAFTSAAIWGILDKIVGQGYSATWIQFWNSGIRLGFFLVVNELIGMLHIMYAQTRKLSRTDMLTGLANARVFQEFTHQVIVQSRRNGQPFTITYIDLDRFKLVNDKFGHSEGDLVLKEIATLIVNGVRTTDLVARLGGDEFAILMPETGMEHAMEALKRIAVSITDHVEILHGVGATLGAVTFREPPEDVDTAIRQADELMYKGKGEGRGCILSEVWPAPVVTVKSQSS